MRIMQPNINHCKATHDLFVQTKRDLKLDFVLISEPKKHLVSFRRPSSKPSFGPVVSSLFRIQAEMPTLAL